MTELLQNEVRNSGYPSIVKVLLIGLAFVGGLLLLREVTHFAHPEFTAAGDVVAATTSPDGWADEQSCHECHEQAEEFHQTGHANTLSLATDADSVKLLKALASSEIGRQERASVEVHDDRVFAVCETNGVTQSVEVDWCFGSGTHARTWVGTLPDSFGAFDLLELRWTWYHQTGSFDITPGQLETKGMGAVATLGTQFDAPRAWRCFSCHATQLPMQDGRIKTAHISPGVTCQRCHGPRLRHVESDGDWHDPNWQLVDRDAEMNLCAECHRRPEEQKKEEIRPENADIVRFQPVGLSQSACFINSEMKCTTCHNPHRPLNTQDSTGIWQCIQCHDPDQPVHVTCGAGMTDNCMGCHMPKVKQESPVSFTDHWIRVRDDSELSP